MQKLIFSTLVLLAIPFHSFAGTLEAKPLADVISTIENTKFEYKETGLIYGFDTTQSCLFVSESMVVLKNYCFPKKAYPAKGYTIISAKFGIVELYQEERSNVLQRDVLIMNFPEAISPYLPSDLTTLSVQKLNEIMEDLYPKYQPACWSTNFSVYSEVPEARCTVNSSDVDGFDIWSAETQKLTLDKGSWTQLIKKMESLFKK